MPGILLFLFRGFQRNFLGILVFFSRNLVEIAAISSCFFFWWGVLIAEISFGSYARDSLLLGDPRDASWNS